MGNMTSTIKGLMLGTRNRVLYCASKPVIARMDKVRDLIYSGLERNISELRKWDSKGEIRLAIGEIAKDLMSRKFISKDLVFVGAFSQLNISLNLSYEFGKRILLVRAMTIKMDGEQGRSFEPFGIRID
ncbi:MAG: hypothetical protein NT030_04110 [Candidatus Saganbacteria bacterium]|nr:hypothetical protein [Candidatus Saganbacteria bacterium]